MAQRRSTTSAESITPQISKPHCFRLPKPGVLDPYFGGTRTFWNERVLPSEANRHKPPVKSIVVKVAGAKRGIRFVLYSSAESYFRSLEKAQSQSAGGA